MVVEEPQPADENASRSRRAPAPARRRAANRATRRATERGKTVHGEAANAGHRVLAPDDAEVEAYLEIALNAPARQRPAGRPTRPSRTRVVVLDFGSQFAQLIARRVRELNVYSELLPHDTPWAEIERRRAEGDHPVGRPELRLRRRTRPSPTRRSGAAEIPVLGICYGAQLMAHELGGDVVAGLEARVRAGDRDDHRPTTASSPASTATSRSG